MENKNYSLLNEEEESKSFSDVLSGIGTSIGKGWDDFWAKMKTPMTKKDNAKGENVVAIEKFLTEKFTGVKDSLVKSYPNASASITGIYNRFMGVVNRNIPFGKQIVLGIAALTAILGIWKAIKFVKKKITDTNESNNIPQSLKLTYDILDECSTIPLNEALSESAAKGNMNKILSLGKTVTRTIDPNDKDGKTLISLASSVLTKLF